MRITELVVTFIVGTTFASFVAFAWTGPTATPPNGNVAAPVNVGTVDQIKSAGLGLNALAVFGNAIISTANGYLNFGDTVGASGYGIRDNVGTLEFKNSGGNWASLNTAIQNYLTLGASTTQTTASGSANHGFQQFTSSGTFTVPSGVTSVKVVVVGGGGGGGSYGSAGGSGGRGIAYVNGLSPGASISVTIGAAGSSVTQTSGGATRFGSYVTAGGGVAGQNCPGCYGAHGTVTGASGVTIRSYGYTPLGDGTGYGSGYGGDDEPGAGYLSVEW